MGQNNNILLIGFGVIGIFIGFILKQPLFGAALGLALGYILSKINK